MSLLCRCLLVALMPALAMISGCGRGAPKTPRGTAGLSRLEAERLADLVSLEYGWDSDDAVAACEANARTGALGPRVVETLRGSLEVGVPKMFSKALPARNYKAGILRWRCLLIFESCGGEMQAALPLLLDLLERRETHHEYAGGPRLLERVLAAVSHRDPTMLAARARDSSAPLVRLACATALGKMRLAADKAAKELLTLLRDPDDDVVVEALLAIDKLERVTPSAMEGLQERLASTEDSINRERLEAVRDSWASLLEKQRHQPK